VRRQLSGVVVACLLSACSLGAGSDSDRSVAAAAPPAGESTIAAVPTTAVSTATVPTTDEPSTTVTTPTPTTTTSTPPPKPEPPTVRGVRVSAEVAADPERFDQLLDMVEGSTVNGLVFDTKTESGDVLYATDVAFATEIGAVNDVYDPGELLAEADRRDLYAITRIVAFEDDRWARARPDGKLGGTWMSIGDEANWDYPLDLAVEACRLGFDEIQFDYVRFPDGRTAQQAKAAGRIPTTQDERTEAVAGFLAEAREQLHAEGCGVSAAIFGIVTASVTDEGIGQRVETVAPEVDAVSPMLYPSHYGRGWIGYDDPNDHPGPVVAHALEMAEPKMADGTLMRPWIQGFYYNGAQVMAQIAEAEKRGAGWIIWNAYGNYRQEWLPPAGP
jgi:hypothetical protein